MNFSYRSILIALSITFSTGGVCYNVFDIPIVRYSDRLPEGIKKDDLHDGFLLPKALRDEIKDEISEKNQEQSNKFIEREHEGKLYEIYIIKNSDGLSTALVIGNELGSGAFGVVYSVQDIITGKWYYIKKIHESISLSNKASDYKNEIKILREKGMFKSYEIVDDEHLFIGELIFGKTLEEIIKNGKDLSFEQVLALNISLIEAYDSLYRKNKVHRDIKPANVMVDMEQQKCIAIDFGSVMKNQKSMNLNGMTRDYLPGNVLVAMTMKKDNYGWTVSNLKDDIYAIGLTAGELLSSRYDKKNFITYRGKKNFITYWANSKKIKDKINDIDDLIKKVKLKRFVNLIKNQHITISPIILGAYDEKYQKAMKLTQAEIDLNRLVFDMTNVLNPELRPSLDKARERATEIRLQHIDYKINNLNDVYDLYNVLVLELKDLRDNHPSLQDEINIFLLRMLDEKQQNRPKLEIVNEYYKDLLSVLNNKGALLSNIKKTNDNIVKKDYLEVAKAKAKANANALKTILDSLSEDIHQYLSQYSKRKKIKKHDFWVSANTNKKFENVNKLSNEIKELLNIFYENNDDDFIDKNIKSLNELIKKHRKLNKKSMGWFSRMKKSEVELMLKKAEKSLNTLQHPAKIMK